MSLFTSLRRQHLSTDEKDHDSDSDENNTTPLLSSTTTTTTSPLFPQHNSSQTTEFFPLRIKLNDGTQPNNSRDFVLKEISPG